MKPGHWPMGLAIGLAFSSAPFAAESPNILWIITDDQRSDSLACYNEAVRGTAENALGYVYSPNVDALAAEGVLFTQAFCNSPACAPSRSSMHTGKYPHRNGMYGFRKAHQAADCASRVIPELMKQHGYQPSMFGKSGFYIFDWEGYHQWKPLPYYQPFIHRNDLEKTAGSDFWFNRPWGEHKGKGTVLGNEEVFRYADGTIKRFWTHRVDRDITEAEVATRREVEQELDILRTHTRKNPELIIGGVSPNTTGTTLDGAIVNCMLSYLANRDKAYKTITGDPAQGPDPAQPVFIHLGFCFPHTPVLPTREFRDRFADKQYRIPLYSPAEAERMPPSLRDLRNDMDFSRMRDEEKQQAIRDYYAFCALGDHYVGEAVRAFKNYCSQQQQEYLIVFVCGDHGWHLGEQGIEAKFGPWFESTHGSVIVVSSDKDRFPPGTVCQDWVEYVDLAPTFYEIAGIDSTRHPDLDGISLLSTLAEGQQRDYVLGEMNQVHGDRAYLRSKNFAFSMRVRPYVTKPGEGYEPGENIRWGLDAPAADVDMALYDLRVDPAERVNVAHHHPYEELAALFRNKLGNIVLGDGRVECDWTQKNKFHISNFSPGAHDRRLEIPEEIVPSPQLPKLELGVEISP